MVSLDVVLAIVGGIAVPLILALVGGRAAAYLTGGRSYWSLVKGTDGTYSLANLQLLLWTIAVVGGYVSLSILNRGFLGSINDSLLGLLGVSAGSTVVSAGIRGRRFLSSFSRLCISSVSVRCIFD